MAAPIAGLLAGDPADQWHWHESYRDLAKNMYRTSYADMSRGLEVSVKSDFPSGYGGHIPSVRHDMLFRNTAFDREVEMRKTNPNRDAHQPFEEQKSGVPCITLSPLGAKKPPTYGTIPHDSTTTMPKTPWAIIATPRDPLTHRTTPPTFKGLEAWRVPVPGSGSMSARGVRSSTAPASGSATARSRRNAAAQNAGSLLASEGLGADAPAATPPPQLQTQHQPQPQPQPQGQQRGGGEMPPEDGTFATMTMETQRQPPRARRIAIEVDTPPLDTLDTTPPPEAAQPQPQPPQVPVPVPGSRRRSPTAAETPLPESFSVSKPKRLVIDTGSPVVSAQAQAQAQVWARPRPMATEVESPPPELQTSQGSRPRRMELQSSRARRIPTDFDVSAATPRGGGAPDSDFDLGAFSGTLQGLA